MKSSPECYKIIVLSVVILVSMVVSGGYHYQGFDKPFITDSASTIMIPIYNEGSSYRSLKISYESPYSDLLVYNFKNKKQRKLFNRFTQIQRIYGVPNRKIPMTNSSNRVESFPESKWILLFVKENDTNKDNHLDQYDPMVIYACKKDGSGLRKITNEKINALDVEVFESQGFYLIKIQFDVNHDHEFSKEDIEFGYLRVDHESLMVTDTLEAF